MLDPVGSGRLQNSFSHFKLVWGFSFSFSFLASVLVVVIFFCFLLLFVCPQPFQVLARYNIVGLAKLVFLRGLFSLYALL